VILDPYTINPQTNQKTKIGLSWFAAEGFTKGLVGRQYTTKGLYSAPVTADLGRAIALWNPLHVSYTPPSLHDSILSQVHQEQLLLDNAKIQDAWKEFGLTPNPKDFGLVVHPDETLRLKDYQVVAA